MSDEIVDTDTTEEDFGSWEGVLVVTGSFTGDRRFIDDGALTHRDLPLPLMVQFQNPEFGGHAGAVIAANIERIWTDGSTVYGAGRFDRGEDGQRARQMVKDGMLRGISVDLDSVSGELGEDADGEFLKITSARIMGACYDDQTEILTRDRGWVSFADLSSDDYVASMIPSTKEFVWSKPHYYHHENWDGDMYHFTNNGLDLKVTPSHRMLVENIHSGEIEFVSAETLANSDRKYKIPTSSLNNGEDLKMISITVPDIPSGKCGCGCGGNIEPRLSWEGGGRGPGSVARVLPGHHQIKTGTFDYEADSFIELVGLYVAEGSLQRKNGRVCGIQIAQKSYSKGYELIEQVLTKLNLNFYHDGDSFRIANVILARFFEQLGRASDKYFPQIVKEGSKRQLGLLLNAYLAGDGSFSSNDGGVPMDFNQRNITSTNTPRGTWKAYTVSKSLVGDLMEVSQRIGMWSTFTTRKTTPNYIEDRLITSDKPQYVISFKNRPGGRSSEYIWSWNVEKVKYKGDVRCVSVENECLYVRRNGKPVWCGNTATPFPAFAEAGFTLVASGAEMNENGTVTISTETSLSLVDVSNTGDSLDVEALVASGRMSVTLNAAPIEPPSFWFDKPTFKTVQPVTVDKNGRVFGHVAAWGSCHISFKDCRDVPKCGTYKKFMNKTVLCDDGVLRPSGVVFINTVHANTRVNADVAADHYADTGAAVADVAVYEDEFGLVIAGAVRPDATPEAVRVFRGSDISPDWRKVRSTKNKSGKWELVGLLSVNTSGFVVDSLLASGESVEEIKPVAGIVDGEIVSLVASGMVSRQLSVDDRLNSLESLFKDIDDLKTALFELKSGNVSEFNVDDKVSDSVGSDSVVDTVEDVVDSVDEEVVRTVAARFGYLTASEKLQREHAELLSKFEK